MQKTFYSNGKLLLSGEYAILDGAVGLAVPTKYGQTLQVTETSSGVLEWESFDENGSVWFECTLGLENLEEISTSDKSISITLIQLLNEAKAQNSSFLDNGSGIKVETKLSFPRVWGLGTSSTLINNIAQWAQVDAYRLLQKAFGGSGYDIACAKHNVPVLYQLIDGIPKVDEIPFDPPYKDSLYFVYLNQKQSSKEAISNYRNQSFDKDLLLSNISTLTKSMVEAESLHVLESLMIEHEATLSKVLGLVPIKVQLFSDYPGAIKSLGAWGGDFILATGDEKEMDYFKSKGYHTIISYTEMVIAQ
ncbi:GYDIA family GHMP kinase [Flagellimonas sp. S3867]|uniref:GYDIA family GHMP kinase n=1 Tax=Flagellimonas sp. S3867 TaxID=2768063 RepID=UPI0016864A54|nr:GYDIA family GHMP kinase [Flagellimonas sp. S3867]